MSVKKTYTLYWINGQKDVIKGFDFTSAFVMAGFTNSHVQLIDFYMNGEDTSYSYENKKWIKK